TSSSRSESSSRRPLGCMPATNRPAASCSMPRSASRTRSVCQAGTRLAWSCRTESLLPDGWGELLQFGQAAREKVRRRMSCVLVLNQNYEPLNVCNARRALVLVDGGKAEVLEHADHPIRTPNRLFQRPSVIRLVYMIKRPRPRVRLTRREIFIRDHHACQYCGIRTRDLTL